jgi:hypothetical protein
MKNIRKTDRRRALGKIAATLVAPWIISSESRAQAAWPVKPVRYINPLSCGRSDRHAVAPVLRAADGDHRQQVP